MTKLLDEAIERLRQLPATMQDSAARVLIRQLEEEPEPATARRWPKVAGNFSAVIS